MRRHIIERTLTCRAVQRRRRRPLSVIVRPDLEPPNGPRRGVRGGRTLSLSLALVSLVGSAAGPGAVKQRPLVDAPPKLLSEATQPCVLYTCAGAPAPYQLAEHPRVVSRGLLHVIPLQSYGFRARPRL